MNICACGCQQPCKKRFVHGHYGKWLKKQRADAIQLSQSEPPTILHDTIIPDTLNYETIPAPPAHPLPYDHGKWRVCEEALGTDLTQPWILDYCLECRLPTWTHNAVTAAKHETLCESCAYTLVTELTEGRVKKENRTRAGYNPFE